MNTIPASIPADVAEVMHDQFTGLDPELFAYEAKTNLECQAWRDPVKYLYPHLENDVDELAKLAIIVNQTNSELAHRNAERRITEMCERAMGQYINANVDAEIARLVEEEREEAA